MIRRPVCRGPPLPRMTTKAIGCEKIRKWSETMDEIHTNEGEEFTHPCDDPYIRGLLSEGGELEWLWGATITLTIDGRVLFVDPDKDGRFSRRTLLVDPEDAGALFASLFCPWTDRWPTAGSYPISESSLDELDDLFGDPCLDPDFRFGGAGNWPEANSSSEA